jgi:hypothetical protein
MCVNLEPGLVVPDPENADRRWCICDDVELSDDVRLEVDGCEEPSSGARRTGSRPVIPVRREENVDIKPPNWSSVRGDVENRASSYCETKVSQRSFGLIRPNDARRSRYSRRPQVEGRWRSATIRASGIEPAPGERVVISR